ncbi:hypothetical protein X777_10189 [Ooceraea biroi]|uniref:SANTA domain-containing protein n=1 Tax=Ooceraea biroi TaxID=2015173 RepID=A0A026X550_OOCBI|nr:hypothetical protein X777_10189 [Ooceraea biroi]
MANLETTFGSLETDERFKKLERSLKLALLKKEHSKSDKVHSDKVTHWPSISSINVDALDSSCATPLQVSTVGSEVLASSNNLRKILSRKKLHNNNRDMISTSSVKEYNVKQDNHSDQFIMPPPTRHTVYRTSKKQQEKIYMSSDCEKAESITLNSFVSSSIRNNTFSLRNSSYVSANTNTNNEYLHSFNAPVSIDSDPQKVDRVFSRWRVMLNNQYELIIKGTLECGKVVRSKPVIRRYTATCVESKFKHKYNLQGNIVDERNELPDYIRGKFCNGFPDDWENIYQVWRTYVSQGRPVTFRWPTTITDSDDDLKSELTDLTYMHVRNNRSIPTMKSHKSEHVRSEIPSIKESPGKVEKFHNHSTRSFISDTERNANPVAQQTSNVRLTCEEGKRDTKISPACSPRRANKLKDILQEDKLQIIIDNLADKNCSPQYIDKILDMLDCLDYVVSYRSGSESKCDSVVSVSCETKSEAIPLQQVMHNDTHVSTKNPANRTMETKSYTQSTDLGYGSIRNDSHPTQLSNPQNSIRSEYNDNKDLDESESEIYAGVPRVSIERVLKMREASGKIHRRKMRKKLSRLDAQDGTTSPENNTEKRGFTSVHTTVPVTNSGQNLLPNESCVSITEDEVETVDTRKCQTTVNQERQEATCCSHQRNINIYGENKPTTIVQKKQLFDPFDAQRVKLNAFIKEQELPHKVHENGHSQFIADVDYTASSDIDVISINTDKQKLEIQNRNMMKMHTNSDVVISSESNSNPPEKSRVPRELRREFIEQPNSESPTKRVKPTIISSVPVKLNLKISNVGPTLDQPCNSDVSITENEENQCTNVPPTEETRKKSVTKTSIAVKPAITTTERIKRDNPKPKNRNESDNVNSANSPKSVANPTTRQQTRSSKPPAKNDPKVLTAWMPKVIYHTESKSKLGLIFQGKLLNEAGHVINRKFITDIVLKRLSVTLIETVKHEIYQLLGCLNDNKHILPKELARQCRNGCPAKIEQFCLTWKTLQLDDMHIVGENSHDATMDSLSVPVSSRGRRILPPLCYWTGERVTLKDNNPVYNPGNLQESLLTSLTETSKKNSEERKKQKANSNSTSKNQGTNKQKVSPESNEAFSSNRNQMIALEKNQSSNKLPKTTVTSDTRTENVKKARKSMIHGKRQIAQQLTYSTDSSEKEEASPRKYARKSSTNAGTDVPSSYTMTLRKRQKVETSPNKMYDAIKSKHNAAYCSPTRNFKKATYTYYKDIPLAEDLLSENPASPK